MDTAIRDVEVPPEDRDLVSQLATLQNMHDQVRTHSMSICACQKKPLLTEYDARSLTYVRFCHSVFGILS